MSVIITPQCPRINLTKIPINILLNTFTTTFTPITTTFTITHVTILTIITLCEF